MPARHELASREAGRSVSAVATVATSVLATSVVTIAASALSFFVVTSLVAVRTIGLASLGQHLVVGRSVQHSRFVVDALCGELRREGLKMVLGTTEKLLPDP